MQSSPPNDKPARLLGRRPLQPSKSRFSPEEDHDRDFLDELASWEATAEAIRVQRLWDQNIVLDLQLQRYDTSTDEWLEFASALAEYGYSVLKGWLISGTLHRMLASHGNDRGVRGLGKVPEGLRLRPDEAHTLAADVVEMSIHQFRAKTLMHPNPEKRWSPTGGASLKTFFVGRCKMEFPDVYVRWKRQELRIHDELRRYADFDASDPVSSLDLEAEATSSARVEEIFADATPVVRVMFELQDEGYSYNEIAEMLTAAGQPTTTAAVRTNMSRLRTTVKGANNSW